MPGLESEYEQAALKTLRASLGAPGFISGESLVEQEHPDRRLLITKWRDLRAWKAWYTSDTRSDAMQRILPLLTEDERIRIYEGGH